MSNVKFSVIIPNYNKEEYIEECLQSVLNQTYPNYEIIIVDDGSTDRSMEIIQKMGLSYFSSHQLQAGGARNLALTKATGDYIVFLDSDDYLHSNDVLEKLANQITDEDIIFLNFTTDRFGEFVFQEEKEEDLSLKLETTKVGCPTKCFKRTILDGITFPEKQRYEDICFTLRALCRAQKVSYFKDSFFVYRKNKDSNTTKEVSGEVMVDIIRELMNIYKLCLEYPQYKIPLLNRIKSSKLPIRLEVLNDLIEFNINNFDKYSF
ncbi:MAG: glycosyltransferase family 2 protein [Bacilli bacterium]|nr:glycosyltransferase family 2 protein [Bacilli bacterium]